MGAALWNWVLKLWTLDSWCQNWILEHTIGVREIRGLVVGIRKCPTPGHQNVQPKLGILFLTGRQPCQQVHMTDVIYILTKYRMRVRNSLLVVSINKDCPWPKNKNLQNKSHYWGRSFYLGASSTHCFHRGNLEYSTCTKFNISFALKIDADREWDWLQTGTRNLSAMMEMF